MNSILQDKMEIIQLAARYCHAIDDLDAEAFARLFTAEGAIHSDGNLRARGHQQLIEQVIEPARRAGLQRRHWNCNPVIEVCGSSATMRLYVMVFDITSKLTPYLMGEYRDTLSKEDGDWRFVERRAAFCAGFVLTGDVPRLQGDDTFQ